MKTIVHFPIDEQAKLSVKVGDKIGPKTIVGEISLPDEDSVVPIAELLHIKADLILKYLRKRIGERVSVGDIIAKKKSFLSSCLVKSPVSGKLKGIDLKKGTLILSEAKDGKKGKIIFPVNGKVKGITKALIEIEIEGEVLRTSKGGGSETVGKIHCFDRDTVGVLDIPGDVEGGIIVCAKLANEAVAKLEVLSVAGLIVQKPPKETDLSWVEVGREIFKKLFSREGKTAWLRPKEKEIVIIDS